VLARGTPCITGMKPELRATPHRKIAARPVNCLPCCPIYFPSGTGEPSPEHTVVRSFGVCKA
jgi:hypothetical protein